ncbi:hypothetical protein AALO_G00148660 [Alosa alosa]|uniref:Uncharacterized protein n=1 Tax=Alosa alosa TaxID=278164 RepID=A0AAV6GK57_9TELE|nr:hypothetical protein AALO_G00148660 [Alosa alosa]
MVDCTIAELLPHKCIGCGAYAVPPTRREELRGKEAELQTAASTSSHHPCTRVVDFSCENLLRSLAILCPSNKVCKRVLPLHQW